VREEITNPYHRSTLDAAIGAGAIKLESVTELDALTTFTELIAHIGRGEAACIAIAAKRGWSIASDEKRRFRREAMARLSSDRIIGTADVFVLAIQAGYSQSSRQMRTNSPSRAGSSNCRSRRFESS